MGKRYYTLIVYFRLLFFQSYSPKKTYTMVLIFITSKYLTVSCIPATIVSDICRVCFRYLSYSFQISVVFVLDICRVCFRYLSCLFQISVSRQLYILINICRQQRYRLSHLRNHTNCSSLPRKVCYLCGHNL